MLNNQTSRYDFLDNLKWVLTVLVILHHAAAAAGLDPIGFNLPKVVLSEQWQYNVLSAFQGNNQSFFMATFFFISALFVVSSYRKKGSKVFFLEKCRRLGIPTLIWLFVILPVLSWATSNHYAIKNITGFFHTGQIDLGVTWFCWTLIVFNLAWLLVVSLSKKENEVIKSSPIPKLWIILAFSIAMIPLNLLGLFLQNKLGSNFLGFHLLKYFPMYIALFSLGIRAYRSNWINALEFKHAFFGILLWIFSRAYLGPILSGYGVNADVLCRGFTVVGMLLFLIYGFKILFNKKTKVTSFLSRIAFPTYVFQIPFLILSTKFYEPWMTQQPIVNFVMIALPSVTLSFAFGYLVCKMPILKKIF